MTMNLAIICIIILQKTYNENNRCLKCLKLLLISSNLICFFSTNILFIISVLIFTSVKAERLFTRISRLLVIIILITSIFFIIMGDIYFSTKIQRSLFTRVGAYITTINKIKQNPVLGIGSYDEDLTQRISVRGYMSNISPHNAFLQVVSHGGLLLFALMLTYLLYIYRNIENILLKRFFIFHFLIYGFVFSIFSLVSFNDVFYAILAISSSQKLSLKDGISRSIS